MNLGVFNRVNLKDSTSGGMYSEWASLTNVIQNKSDDYSSVLNKLPIGSGRDVTLAVVKQLASNLGISQPAEPSPLVTDKEVQWCMEVLCHGLSLPLSEHDTIRDCVNVYCEWLSALHPTPKICVPKPICDDPNVYARKIISHFHNLFVPRKGEVWTFFYLDTISSDTINRQAVLCHRVLRTLQQLAQVSSRLDRETWEALLQFLLAINDTLLSPPTIKDDVGDQLCERVLSVLVEVWLVACVRCFPTPPLWKTLRELAMTWRHRLALIEQWNRVNLTLTSKLLEFMYGPTFPELKISDEDAQVMPSGMSPDCIAQCWFRFLHTLGSPVDLSRPQVISQTPAFLQHALTNDLADPSLHPCLVTLPVNFCKAIKGVASIVDAFLGLPVSTSSHLFSQDESLLKSSGSSTQPSSVTSTHSPTPPQRRLAKSFSISTTSSISKGTPKTSLIGLTSSRISTVGHSSIPPNSGPPSTSSISSDPSSLLESTFPNLLHVVFWTQYGTIASLAADHKGPLAEDRPKCNSILHLFGEWLFEAALIGSDFSKDKVNSKDCKRRPSSIMIDTVSVSSAGSMKGSLSMSQPGSLTDEGDSLTPPLLSPERYQVGRAEALGALCRIFGAKKTGEEILPIYLARFYICLQQGLRVSETRECEEVLSSILLNSTDLFRLDLDGIQLLLPYFLDALELVLTEKDPRIKSQSVSKSELRRASTQILLSLLVLPLHYQNLPIKDLNSCSTSHHGHPLTFESLKPRLVNLVITALQVETDLINTQALLGGLLVCVQDSALFELSSEVAPSSDPPHVPGPESSHIQSSDAASAYSMPHSHHSIDSSSSFDSSNAFHSYDMDWSLPATVNKNSAHALFVRATYLVCHRLISSWKTDLNVSLAALELLSGLARTQIREADSVECKRAVKWLCDYITYQCWRPPQAHSKDLHSTIVAAFQCAIDWLVGHPYLLQDKDCLATVMEVVELGISGTKSQSKPGEPLKMKDEKELKPASLRVRDAAEALLTLILEQVGYFPSVCGPESLSCLLDEISLVKLCNSWPGGQISLEKAVPKFRYFVLENATLLALLEEPLGNDQDPQPSVTLLIRNSFGRLAWTLQLRHLPRHRSHHKHHQSNPGRPLPLDDLPARSLPRPKYFPDSVERIPQHQIDKCIPTLDSLILDDPNHDELSKLIDNQIKTETKIRTQDSGSKGSRSGKSEECTPPPACQEFQTARLFLSHFGFLSKLTDKQNSNNPGAGAPQLLALDTSHPDFCSDLRSLDNIGNRTCDSCHIFYVRNGQKQADEILANVLSDSAVSSSFLDMLYSLGWPVAVNTHPGWTGRHTPSKGQTDSSRSQMDVNELEDTPHGGSLFNGQSHVLYWADVSSEIAFVVPTPDNKHNNPDCDTWKRHSTALGQPQEKPTRSVSVDHQTQSPQQQEPKKKTHPPSTTVMIVWLESFQDSISFPISDLLPYCSTGVECSPTQPRDVFVIFLHALQSELLRVKLQGPPGRLSLATPLIEGMIISRRVVGDLVRQTALNMCRRRRLDSDSYQPPHVKRKLKIQEIVSKYQMQMSQPELLTFLLSNNESIFNKNSQTTSS
uniref:Ral GTPase-activating protein subunit beta n=2 Tax=Cacopsylla melanoneura TaxID=428564 RepID=A0A8D8UV98_9HEMI